LFLCIKIVPDYYIEILILLKLLNDMIVYTPLITIKFNLIHLKKKKKKKKKEIHFIAGGLQPTDPFGKGLKKWGTSQC
jgi:accessory gene regulator protein AgrB